VLRGRGDDGAGPTATTTSTTAPVTVSTEQSIDNTTTSDVTTPTTAAEIPPLTAFIDAVNRSDNELTNVGIDPDAVKLACNDFLVGVETNYGQPPDDTNKVPASLRIAIEQSTKDPQLALEIVDTTIRRYEACVAGDQALYLSLRDQEIALRRQLPN
jgi:hypothetical protein